VKHGPNVSTAVKQRRSEAHDSLNDFPTPPWATRALFEHVIGTEPRGSVWEPACNRGYMARPLAEYFATVYTSDIHDYGWSGQQKVTDFLFFGSEHDLPGDAKVDWVITNPPFRLSEQFIRRSQSIKGLHGVAMFARIAFLEGVSRYLDLFSKTPPAIIAQFTERVPIFRGRINENGSSATAYCWIVWLYFTTGTRFTWIPPCRKALERPGDYE
jgi:hypothetical protein